MLVCHCYAVNEAVIRECIARGARDEDDVAAACGAGSCCGSCMPTIWRLLGEGTEDGRPRQASARVVQSR